MSGTAPVPLTVTMTGFSSGSFDGTSNASLTVPAAVGANVTSKVQCQARADALIGAGVVGDAVRRRQRVGHGDLAEDREALPPVLVTVIVTGVAGCPTVTSPNATVVLDRLMSGTGAGVPLPLTVHGHRGRVRIIRRDVERVVAAPVGGRRELHVEGAGQA